MDLTGSELTSSIEVDDWLMMLAISSDSCSVSLGNVESVDVFNNCEVSSNLKDETLNALGLLESLSLDTSWIPICNSWCVAVVFAFISHSSSIACGKTGWIASKHSTTAFLLPGKLMISVWFRIPQIALKSKFNLNCANHGNENFSVPRQSSKRSLLEALQSHEQCQLLTFAVNDIPRCFRGYVAWCKASSARRQHAIEFQLIAEVNQHSLNVSSFIWNSHAWDRSRFEVPLQHYLDCWPWFICWFFPKAPVRHWEGGENNFMKIKGHMTKHSPVMTPNENLDILEGIWALGAALTWEETR